MMMPVLAVAYKLDAKLNRTEAVIKIPKMRFLLQVQDGYSPQWVKF